MTTIKDVFLRLLRFLGFRRNSDYVKKYLNTTNLRVTIWMCLVIMGIEIWMVIRQTNKYYIPKTVSGEKPAGFNTFIHYTANYWLLLSIATALLIFAIGSLYLKKRELRFALDLGLGILSFVAALQLILLATIGGLSSWDAPASIVSNVCIIAVYALGFLFSIGIITYACLAYFKKKEVLILSQCIVSIFGLICLTFGVMVSFTDFVKQISVGGVLVLEYKQIICFLTMVVFSSCLLVYRPIISIPLLGGIFFGFYQLLLSAHDVREFPDGDKVNYLTFVLMLVVVVCAMYSQRHNDATKSEELEFKAKYDALTDLYNYDYFLNLVREKMNDPSVDIGTKVFVFVDLDDFKSFNNRRGFQQGNLVIHDIGECVAELVGRENCAHVFADRFVMFIDTKDLQNVIKSLSEKVNALDEEAYLPMKFGGYVFAHREEDPRRAFDKASYACSLIKRHHDKNYLEYDLSIHRGYHQLQYIIHSLDEAIEKGYIRPYYQPVVWSNDGKLCGMEALCRWIDPKYGFISPGVFVPILESARLVHKLDAAIVEFVCRDIRDGLDHNLPVVPVSINFSRLDFELMDPIALLEEMVRKYNVPKGYLHVEITESALAGDYGNLANGIATLRKLGYAIWLDDFGSGYSTFNVLKEFRFDVLKIDMQFLNNFATNKNARVLIEVIVNMCDRIGMKTLTEGVETKEEADFLKEVGCGRLQGYLFGKAMPLEEIREKIEKGEFKLSANLN